MSPSSSSLWHALSPCSSTSRRDKTESENPASLSSSLSSASRHPESSPPRSCRRSSSPSSFSSTLSTQMLGVDSEPVQGELGSHMQSQSQPQPSSLSNNDSDDLLSSGSPAASSRYRSRFDRPSHKVEPSRSTEQAADKLTDELFISCHPSSEPASFTFVCLGVGGGPLENDCSCYVVKAADRSWRQGMYVLEGGSWLGALTRVCSDSPCRAFHDFDFSHDDPSLRAGEIGSFANAFLISHAHLDHILGMVLGSASLPGKRAVYGLKSTLENLMRIFDGKLWPKLASFREEEQYIVYHLKPIESQARLELDDSLSVLPFALSHGLNGSNLPAPPTPTPLAPRNGYFSKRLSLPLSSLTADSPGSQTRHGSGIDRATSEKPTFTSPFAPDRVLTPRLGHHCEAADNEAQQSEQSDVDVEINVSMFRTTRRPKTASGFERAGLEPLSAPADRSNHRVGNEVDSVPGGTASGVDATASGRRRAAAPRRASIDREQPHGALDSTAFFLTSKTTGKEVLFFGDVEPDCVSRAPRNKRVWQHAASKFAVGKLHALFLECSFPAAHPTEFLWGHLSVNHLYDELMVLARCVKSEKAVLARRSNVAAGALRPVGTSYHAVDATFNGGKGISASRAVVQSLIPPSPLLAPGSSELRGLLSGLTVVIIHVKQALFPSYAESDKSAGVTGVEAKSPGGASGRVLDPRSMQTRILQELTELEEEHELGARFVIAKQGMRLET